MLGVWPATEGQPSPLHLISSTNIVRIAPWPFQAVLEESATQEWYTMIKLPTWFLAGTTEQCPGPINLLLDLRIG